SPAQQWQNFQTYERTIRGKPVTAFGDTSAKAAASTQRNNRQWIRSNEPNSAFFEFRDIGSHPQKFMAILKKQYPKAVGHTPVPKSFNGAIFSFEDMESCTAVCTTGVTVGSRTVFGIITLQAENDVYCINLEQLPLLSPAKLTPLLNTTMSRFGKIAHIGLYVDPISTMFHGKGYAILDRTVEPTHDAFEPLQHVIPFSGNRCILASWKGMEQHCFYCHQHGHGVAAC
ncbi:hypothetical protein BDB00DRAFT_745862, partial [Zychaea mexicana]|uniref:uncharacterized protein n=1 Tax=Zychaea mexicana TaxID=64656 RepID=UPI0022FF0087